jgi:hypothetical protein
MNAIRMYLCLIAGVAAMAGCGGEPSAEGQELGLSRDALVTGSYTASGVGPTFDRMNISYQQVLAPAQTPPGSLITTVNYAWQVSSIRPGFSASLCWDSLSHCVDVTGTSTSNSGTVTAFSGLSAASPLVLVFRVAYTTNKLGYFSPAIIGMQNSVVVNYAYNESNPVPVYIQGLGGSSGVGPTIARYNQQYVQVLPLTVPPGAVLTSVRYGWGIGAVPEGLTVSLCWDSTFHCIDVTGSRAGETWAFAGRPAQSPILLAFRALKMLKLESPVLGIGTSGWVTPSFYFPPVPTVRTSWPTANGNGNFTFRGGANPQGYNGTAHFRYSTTNPGVCNDSFGQRVPASGGTAISPTTVGTTDAVQFAQTVSLIAPLGRVGYYCAIVSSSQGLGYGDVIPVNF